MSSVLFSLSLILSACLGREYTVPWHVLPLLHEGSCLVEGKIKLGIVSKCMCVGQVQLDDLEQLAGIGTEE